MNRIGMGGKRIARIAIALLMAVLAAGCGGFEMDAHRRDKEIAVDGRNEEWADAIVYVEDADICVGAVNDDEDLYLCLVVDDSDLRREIIGRGLTLWIDPSGGKKKRIGIHYPLGGGGREEGGPPGRNGSESFGGSKRGEPPAMDSTKTDREKKGGRFGGDTTWEEFRKKWPEVEMFGPGEDETYRIAAGKGGDVEVALSVEKETLVYELRIPLALNADHPFGVGTAAGETIGVGLETPEMEKPSGGRHERGGGGFGGSGGGFGGRGGGPPGGGERSGPSSSDRIEAWAKVRLAVAAE